MQTPRNTAQRPTPPARVVLTIPGDAMVALRDQAARQYRTTKAEATRLLIDGLRREGAL